MVLFLLIEEVGGEEEVAVALLDFFDGVFVGQQLFGVVFDFEPQLVQLMVDFGENLYVSKGHKTIRMTTSASKAWPTDLQNGLLLLLQRHDVRYRPTENNNK